MSFTWDDVVAHALTLPEVELASHYRAMVPKRNGKAICAPGHHPDDSFVLMLPMEAVDMLVEAEPEHFYQTPHYVGWPGVLVRWETPWETVAFWIGRAWEARAKRPRARKVSPSR